MRLPPWAIEAIRNGVADVARKASDAETIAKVKDQAAELLRDLPESASRGLDAIVKTATQTARGAVNQGRETVRRWNERQTDLTKPLTNASGVLFHEYGTGISLSDHVAHAGFDFLRGDGVQQDTRVRLSSAMDRMLDMPGYRMAVASNLDAAIMSLAAIASSHDLIMHRSQAIRLPSGAALPDVLSRAIGQAAGSKRLKECGGIQSIAASDFDTVDQACVVMADDGIRPIVNLNLRGTESLTVAIAPFATLKDSDTSLVSAKTLLQDGADLVIVGGGVLTGSAETGILIGRAHAIEIIIKHPGWSCLQSALPMAATVLGAMTNPDPSPLMSLLDTNEQNLRSRAERLATQLSANDRITSCQVTDQPAVLVEGMRWQFPTRQLRIRHQSHSPQQWAQRLSPEHMDSLDHVISVGNDGDDLVVDLRWVPADQDAIIVESLLQSADH